MMKRLKSPAPAGEFLVRLFTSAFFLLTLIYGPAAHAAEETAKPSSLPLPPDLKPLTTIRVLILRDKWSVKLETPTSYRITDKMGNLLASGKQMRPTVIKPLPKGIQFGGQRFNVSAIRIKSPYEIKIGKLQFLGIVEIALDDKTGKLLVINELPLEEYLKAVLPREVNPEWPLDALKAQAIASRTYAVFHIIRTKNKPYAVNADVTGQVYRGSQLLYGESNAAVTQTRGQILTYQNAVFPAFFHASCGGSTTSIENLWNYKSHPCMTPVKCEFCKGSLHYEWQARYTGPEIETMLAKHGFRVSGVRSISATNIDPSGRALTFVATGANGAVSVPANIFRMALDPFRFKSTKLEGLDHDGNSFVFRGTGWGHGVGLCQYGAKRLGELGYKYGQILQFYYPKSELLSLPAE